MSYFTIATSVWQPPECQGMVVTFASSVLLAGTYLKIRNHRGIDDVYELFGRNLSGADLHVDYRVLPGNGLKVFI